MVMATLTYQSCTFYLDRMIQRQITGLSTIRLGSNPNPPQLAQNCSFKIFEESGLGGESSICKGGPMLLFIEQGSSYKSYNLCSPELQSKLQVVHSMGHKPFKEKNHFSMVTITPDMLGRTGGEVSLPIRCKYAVLPRSYNTEMYQQ